jgi:hypothetical protein
MMTTQAAARFAGLMVAVVCAGCDGGGGTPGEPIRPPPAISYATADLSTGVRAASIQVRDSLKDVSLDFLDAIVRGIRVATWPGDVAVPATFATSTVAGGQTTAGGIIDGHGQIDVRLDDALDGSAWYAISLPEQPADYGFPGSSVLFAFDGARLGVRISPAHAPVIASVLSCAKGGTTVAMYARFSEPVAKSDGALAVEYGTPASPCTVGGDSASETQFICTGAAAGLPFSLHVLGAVTSQATAAQMATGTLISADMQVSVTNDGCPIYKPVLAGAQ